MRIRLRRLGGVAGLALLVVVFSAPAGLVQAAFFWHTEIAADNATGFNVSMALDSAGRPHITYQDFANGTLNYAHYNGTSWVNEIVDSGGLVGSYSSIVLDDQDRPHISYSGNEDGRLKYAYFTGTTWVIEVVDESVTGIRTSLALDSQGRPHIAYARHITVNMASLKYAYHDGTHWVTMTLDDSSDTGWYASLALDGDDQPHIGYWDRGNWLLKYTHFANGSWTTETIDGDGSTFLGSTSSLALDGAGQPHVGYWNGDTGDLKYARRDGGGWHIQTVDTSGSVESAAIAIDSNDRPHISYFDANATALKYTYFDGTDWQFLVTDGAVDVGWLPALVLDSDDLAHVSYIDIENRDAKYTYLTVNDPPTVEAGGPYTGVEGNPITLQATVDDPETDELTTAWSYTIDTADPGTTCAFGDPSQVETTFTCTDDGTFTLTLAADDGLNPAVADSATVTISNAPPTITDSSSTLSGSRVTVTVTATDPGQNDVLSYAFDCNADDTYEIDPQAGNSATCTFGNVEGTFQIGVQVSDDDGGVTTDSVTVSIPTLMCANTYTAVLRYSADCRDYETAVILPDDAPVTVCANIHTSLLRAPSTSACARYEISYVLPEDGPLNVCVSRYTQVMRAVDDIAQCASHEDGRVIAATEIGETGPPRSR